MNLKELKNSVLTGTDEAKSNFVSTLKGRYIKPTDETVMVNGVEEKLFYNSENGTYFDRCMTIYRKCPGCGNIKPVSDFVTCPILPEQRYRHEGKRVERETEFVCRDCVEEGNFVVPCKIFDPVFSVADGRFYIYRKLDKGIDVDYKTVELEYRDENGNIVHGFTIAKKLAHHSHFFYRWNYETDKRDKSAYGFYDSEDITCVAYPDTYGETHYADLLREEVEAHPETWKQCPHCGKWFHHSLNLENGICKKCADEIRWAEICPPYHGWTEKTKFLSSESEVVDDHTLFFGLEIPVWHYASHVRENLLGPIADIFHLERVNNDKFYIVSHLMTLNYLKENIGRIKEVLDILRDKGIKLDDDLIVNTPFSAHKGKEALRRACGIVIGFKKEILGHGMSPTSIYSWYENIGTTPSTEQLDEIVNTVLGNGGRRMWDDMPIYFTNGNDATIPTVNYEVNIFSESITDVITCDISKIVACVELVNNIVEMANSDKAAVDFSDLVSGDYLPELVKSVMRYASKNGPVYFGVKDRIDKVTEALEAFARSGQPIEAADDAINRLLTSLSASDESKSDE